MVQQLRFIVGKRGRVMGNKKARRRIGICRGREGYRSKKMLFNSLNY